MNTLLLFFALPVATIILSIVLEKILRCPILTAATFFAIFLIVAFAVFDATFLVFVIAYTILSFISALIAEIIFRRCNDENRKCCRWCLSNSRTKEQNNNMITLSNQDVIRIANEIINLQNNITCNQNLNNNNCNCSASDVATVNVTNNTTGGRTSWCCYRR